VVAFDLNCDVGELEELLVDGTQQRLMQYATSVNVCCNAHAGSEDLILRTLEMASGLRVGAHPGYPDRVGFGREPLVLTHRALIECIHEQLVWFRDRCRRVGVSGITHVKAHGALYNSAVRDEAIASAIAEACVEWDPTVVLVGLAGSQMLEVFREAGFRVLAEGFADRVYESDGTLRSRKLSGSMIEDPAAAADQAVRLSAVADTICVHSDSVGAVDIAAAVRARLDGMSRMKK